MRYKDLKCKECPYNNLCGTLAVCKNDELCVSLLDNLEKFVDSEVSKLTAEPEKYKISFSPAFEEFWKVYPRHDGKAAAIKSWNKIYTYGKKLVYFQAIIQGAVRYADWIKATGKEEFIAMASTWLNGERWNDELRIPESKGKAAPHADIFTRAMDQVDRMTRDDE
jgi:hypothetical protein